ncbi:MAG: S-layer homology domain-containing protein [Oscillospiraceae bacterium]|nr:S-layer homology domain-containing protein [Oscillospiraceae bacterium]
MKHVKRATAGLLCVVFLLAQLPAMASAEGTKVWDGKSIDVSWYNTTDTEFSISTPEQLMGLAAIVNGIYNKEVTNVIGDEAYIVDNYNGEGQDSGASNMSTDAYHYGADDFAGKTVRLTADLDMGGTYNTATETWTGPNFMPIGGQYLMELNNGETKLSGSFCGTLDGQGHYISNIYCNRRCSNGNYGDGSSVGVIGRLGVHDSDPAEIRPVNPTVKNLAVTGYIYANRSVGGIVGKIGKTSVNNGDGSVGGIVENCANFAMVSNTDAKGCGGIVGASWNGGIIRNCYNAGAISTTFACPTGGICGSNEIVVENCYNVGTISATQGSYAMGIGTNNGGGSDVDNCYWLTGSASGGGYYGTTNGTVTELSEVEMQSADFVTKLKDAFVADTGINNGYPLLAWQATRAPLENTDKTGNTSTQSAFSDVSTSAWYYHAVCYTVEQGLFTGTSDTTFAPDGTMNRAMFVTVMGRLSGADVSGYTTGGFSDVTAEKWYATAVNWAASTGLVNGTGDGKFSPEESISLEAMILVLYRSSGDTASSAGQGVSPVGTASSWAQEAIAWAGERRLFDGVGGTLSAQSPATRAQVAAILMNFGQ